MIPSPLGTWAYTGNTWNDLTLFTFTLSHADITSVLGGYDYTHSASLMHTASGIGFYFTRRLGGRTVTSKLLRRVSFLLLCLVCYRGPIEGPSCLTQGFRSRLVCLSGELVGILDLPWNCTCMYETCLREEVVCMHCSRVRI